MLPAFLQSKIPMGVMERFFGGRDKSAKLGEQLIANPAALENLDNPRSLQVLFPAPIALEPENLKGWLRAYDAELSRAACEIDAATAAQGTPLGLAGWDKHVIQIVAFNAPYPAEGVERGLAALHCTEEHKAAARAHQAHAILYYGGYEESVLEQYVALAAVAGALAGLGATIVLNEGAMCSLPAHVLSSETAKGKPMEFLRTLPFHFLYCGCVRYWVEGTPGAWLRTYGHHLLGVPDLAMLTTDEQAAATQDMFTDFLGYLLESGAKLAAGETVRFGDTVMRLRVPTADEYFLENPGPLFVIEV
jgi:hypothetical protein